MHKLDLFNLYSQKSVLVVDEISGMRASIRRMLRSFGVESIDLVKNGNEAMQHCRDNKYDIIICDYTLGSGKNGQQVLEELRFNGWLKRSSIFLLVTTETTRSMVFGALESKPDDYLAKPFTQVVFQQRLDKIVLEKLFFAAAYTAFEKEDYVKAAALCSVLAGKGKRFRTAALKLRGQALLYQHSYGEAFRFYNEIHRQKILDWTCVGCARALIGLGKWASAKKILTKWLEEGHENLEAFDVFVEIDVALGRFLMAQTTLEKSIISSPSGIQRQIKLADIAGCNGDHKAAEKAFRKVIKLGGNSCYDSAEHSLGLVRCLLERQQQEGVSQFDTFKECRSVLARVKKTYSDPQVNLQIGLIDVKTNIFEEKMAVATENCRQLYSAYTEIEDRTLPLGLDMATACIGIGDRVLGQEILDELAVRFGQDPVVMAKIDVLADEPMSSTAKQNASNINRVGKQLFDIGEFKKAIGHFRKAVFRYPNNVAIRLNLILALYKYSKQITDNVATVTEAEELLISLDYLTRDHNAYARYLSLGSELKKLSQAA